MSTRNHHKLLCRDSKGKTYFKICSIESNCFICQTAIREFHFSLWEDSVSDKNFEFVYYLRFTLDLRLSDNHSVKHCMWQVLSRAVLKDDELDNGFFLENSFGLTAFYHTNVSNYISPSFTFEVFSPTLFPATTLRKIDGRVRTNHFFADCEFSFGSFRIRSIDDLKERQEKIYRRSLSLIKCDDGSTEDKESYYSALICGLAPLKFKENEIISPVLADTIRIVN